MARPRKNPDDPKWQNVGEQVPTDWLTLYAAVLTGLVARGGFNEEQLVKLAAQYADLAHTFITSPRK
jgi:hypothetical protein